MSPDLLRNVLMTMARVFDLAAVCVSFLASFAISSGSSTWPDLASLLIIRIKVANLLLFAGYLALCYVVFAACGFYRSHRLSHWKERLYEVLLAVTLIVVTFLVLKQLFLISFAIKEFLSLFWLLTFCTLLLSHELALGLLRLFRLRGRNLRNVVLVGEGPAVAALADRIRQEASLGYRVLGIIDAREIGGDGRVVGDL
jgi:FlaA1/EpsC-like NDP-sugar epimerase